MELINLRNSYNPQTLQLTVSLVAFSKFTYRANRKAVYPLPGLRVRCLELDVVRRAPAGRRFGVK